MRYLKPIWKLARRLRRTAPLGHRKTLRDQALARRLSLLFERDLELTDTEGLHFYAFRGTVTIYGTVAHELDRDLVIAAVRQLPGVEKVLAHVLVAGRDAPPVPPPRPEEAA